MSQDVAVAAFHSILLLSVVRVCLVLVATSDDVIVIVTSGQSRRHHLVVTCFLNVEFLRFQLQKTFVLLIVL